MGKLRKWFHKKFLGLTLCIVLCLVCMPMDGYGAEESDSVSAGEGRSLQSKEMEFQNDFPNRVIANKADDYPLYTDGDFTFFSEDGKTACISRYNGKKKRIKVPETLSAEGITYTVTVVKRWAIYCGAREITFIEFPETLKTIEEAAFSSECRHVYLPRSISKIEGRLWSDVQYYCWENSYAHQFLKKQAFTVNTGIYCIDNPPKVKSFHSKNCKTKECTLMWEDVGNAGGYVIASCDKEGNIKKNISGTIKNGKFSYRIKGLKSNKSYHYRVCSVYIFNGKEYYGEYSHVLTVRTKPSSKTTVSLNKKIKKGYTAKITRKEINLSTPVYTTYNSLRGNWACVSELTNFWDHKGRYNLACASFDTVYITRYDISFKKKSTIKIKKKYPLLGDVICDDNGNYYIVWGKNDTAKKGNYVTMAVSKYTYSGKHIWTSKFRTGRVTEGSSDTRFPFDAGNCSSVIKGGQLYCTFAREMYNGHQSSTMIAVNTSNGKKREWSPFINVSHSFDQRIIATKSGGICDAHHGDAYPARGFIVNGKAWFHFYGESGNNVTNAWLGGICETDNGIFLSGASAKSMKSFQKNKNLFILLADSKRRIPGSISRTGLSAGKRYTDKGIKWLTNYSAEYNVANPKIVGTEDNRMVVMWEKFKGYTFVQSYYMVLAGDGTTLQRATPMNGVRFASFEDPMYKNGKIYWTTVGSRGGIGLYKYGDSIKMGGVKGVVNCLAIGKLVKP